jgi:O-antigen/teichoic acid export membrane protein
MLNEIKILSKHFSVYGLGLLLSRAIGFLMIPVYTHYLTPADYGILELLDLMGFVISIVIVLGLHSAVFKYYSHYDQESDKKEVICTATVFVLVLSLAGITVLRFESDQIARILFRYRAYSAYVNLALISLLLTNMAEVPLAYLRARQKSAQFVTITLIRLFSNLSLNVFFVAFLRKGVWGILCSNIMVSLVFASYLTWSTLNETGLRFRWQKLKEQLVFGIPLVPSSVGMFILVSSDRFFLSRFADLTDVGVYGLAYKFGMIPGILINLPLGQIWQARVFEIAKQKDAKLIYARVISLYAFVMLFVSFVLIDFSGFMLRLMSPRQYWGGAVVIPLIAASYFFDGLKGFFQTGMLLVNKTKFIGLATFLTALINLGLNWLLIPRWHAVGAGIATLLSYAFLAVLTLTFSQRLYNVNYHLRRLLTLFAGFVAFSLCAFLVPDRLTYVSLSLRVLLLPAFAFCVWKSRYFDADERQVILDATTEFRLFVRYRLRNWRVADS